MCSDDVHNYGIGIRIGFLVIKVEICLGNNLLSVVFGNIKKFTCHQTISSF